MQTGERLEILLCHKRSESSLSCRLAHCGNQWSFIGYKLLCFHLTELTLNLRTSDIELHATVTEIIIIDTRIHNLNNCFHESRFEQNCVYFGGFLFGNITT